MSQTDHTDQAQSASAKTVIWNDPTFRSIVSQVLAAGVLVWFFYTIFSNTLSNMERQGITTGFAFWNSTAGYGILMSLIDYDSTDTYGRTFFVGLLNTVLISVLGIFFATIIGFIVGVARLSKNWPIAKIATVYVETLRNIPLLLQILFWYNAVLRTLPHPRDSLTLGESIFLNSRGLYLPSPVPGLGFGFVSSAFYLAVVVVFIMVRWANKRQEETGQQFPSFWASVGLLIAFPGVVFLIMGAPMTLDYPALKGFNFQGGIGIIPELLALLWALTFYTATFIAEIVRAGILGVSHGQTEAAHALGLRNGPTLRLVVIPQAMRIIIPPLTSQYLNLAKNSSLATAIGYPDLVAVFMGTTLNQTGQAVEIVGITMAVYLVMSLAISGLMNWFNKRMALSER
ncbi:MAG: amino acid ABC transporter permease [Magnetovibrio sp.]|nr:amino acid ABC transporter permease [Magnetovibrio sp.]